MIFNGSNIDKIIEGTKFKLKITCYDSKILKITDIKGKVHTFKVGDVVDVDKMMSYDFR